ncbi:hypothetical protein E4U53_000037, partial [Claviceps sorghi]
MNTIFQLDAGPQTPAGQRPTSIQPDTQNIEPESTSASCQPRHDATEAAHLPNTTTYVTERIPIPPYPSPSSALSTLQRDKHKERGKGSSVPLSPNAH